MTPKWKSFEIDDHIDFLIISTIMKKSKKIMKKNLGQKILKRAKEIIPGGNQLLSKRSEMFLPNYWPNYYKKVRDVKFGILKIKHITILQGWELLLVL